MLGEEDLSGQSQDDLHETLSASFRAQDLTQQLLAFSRKRVLQPQSMDLNENIRNALKMLSRLIGEHIELVTELDPATAIIKADPTQVEQIIVNLAVNAHDAMVDGGKLTISTRTIEAGSPREAITIFHGKADVIDLVITDAIMPRMSSRELAEQLLESKHDALILFMSGHTDDEIVHHGILEEGVHFAQKPFASKQLIEKVRDILDAHASKPNANVSYPHTKSA